MKTTSVKMAHKRVVITIKNDKLNLSDGHSSITCDLKAVRRLLADYDYSLNGD